MHAARQWRQSKHAMTELCHAIRMPLSPLSPRLQDLGATGMYEDDLNLTDAEDNANSEVQFQYLHRTRADKTGQIELPTTVMVCSTVLFQQTLSRCHVHPEAVSHIGLSDRNI